MLDAAGARVQRGPTTATVWPADRLQPLSLDVSGDFSSAAPFVVAATLLSGSQLVLAGVNVNPTRTGLVDVLGRMGARVAVFNRRSVAGEPVADLSVEHAALTATEVRGEEVPDLVDELPLFALAAAVAHGESLVRGADELRAKESDRIETTAEALRAVGAHVRTTRDGWRIRGVPARLRGGRVASHGDHRIAMLGAVAGLYSRDGVEIVDADAAAVSFPEFYDLLDTLSQR
jgi:3-phosphoshikimate 1-carboxyvinyltransferase